MKAAIALTFSAVLFAGCTTSSNQVTAVGTSPIPPNLQVAFCDDQIAFTTGVEREHLTPGERVVAADGSTTIDVTVDKGSEGVKTFKCRLDASGRFIEAMAPTNDAAP